MNNTIFRTSTLTKIAGAVTALALTASAHADPISDLTDSVDFTMVSVGVMAIASSIIGLYMVIKGVQIILHQVKRA